MAERTEVITNCLAGKRLGRSNINQDGVVSFRCGLSYVSVTEHGCSVSSSGLPDNLCNQRTCKNNKHNIINIDCWK